MTIFGEVHNLPLCMDLKIKPKKKRRRGKEEAILELEIRA